MLGCGRVTVGRGRSDATVSTPVSACEHLCTCIPTQALSAHVAPGTHKCRPIAQNGDFCIFAPWTMYDLPTVLLGRVQTRQTDRQTDRLTYRCTHMGTRQRADTLNSPAEDMHTAGRHMLAGGCVTETTTSVPEVGSRDPLFSQSADSFRQLSHKIWLVTEKNYLKKCFDAILITISFRYTRVI
ncbi:unnamed protein product [Protopolystoma xenopodis]|uniref:Uncharacterized protein n=1 Tax=Protopolystoma xenopodis TaxID=117903 RepID=A0A448WZI9_9PLAT|nr:unnamed protein product [Protopolystoma xenopodis]